MRTLSLLRHAKASRDDLGLSDHARPLALRGREDAPRIGAFIRASGLRPDLVVCSDAVRTRETLALVLRAIGGAAPPVVYEHALYLAEEPALLARLARVDDAVRHVMVVGHNPGLHELALALATKGSASDLVRLTAKFPTAALAVIDFDVSWGDIAGEGGRLRTFVTPRTLA